MSDAGGQDGERDKRTGVGIGDVVQGVEGRIEDEDELMREAGINLAKQ